MSENYVAIGANSLYPEYIGKKPMPEAAVPPPEDTEAHSHSAEGSKPEKTTAEIKREKEAAEKILKEAREAARSKPHEVPFQKTKVVKEAAKNVKEGTEVVLSKKEAREVRDLLAKHAGISPKDLASLNDQQVFFIADKLFNSDSKIKFEDVAQRLHVDITEDFGRVDTKSVGTLATDWLERLPAVNPNTELGGYIQRIRSVAESYEEDAQAGQLKLELERISSQFENAAANDRFRGADVGDIRTVTNSLDRRITELIAQEATIAAAEAERREELLRRQEGLEEPLQRTDIENRVLGRINQLATLQSRGITSGPEWEAAREDFRRLQEMAEAPPDTPLANYDYTLAFYVTKASGEYLSEAGRAGRTIDGAVRTILDNASRVGPGSWLRQINKRFELEYNKLSSEDRQTLFGDIDREATIYSKQIIAGWGRSPNQAKQSLERMRIAGDTLRDWKVTRAIAGLQLSIDVDQLTQPPINWEDTPEKIANIYRFIEAKDFSIDDLQLTINKAINMINQVRPDTPEGRVMQERLSRELEAFRAFHSMRITMERNSMNPERLQDVYSQYFDDETWATFSGRFARDERDLQYFDSADNKVNLFDTAFKLYSEKLLMERIRMNIVEAMTKHAIENSFDSAAKRDIQIWAGLRDKDGSLNPFFAMTEADFDAEVERLRIHFKDKMQTYINKHDLGKRVDEVWGLKRGGGIAHTKSVVAHWHTQETLEGAVGFNEETGNPYLDERRGEMRGALEARLSGMGLKVRLAGEGDTAQYKDVSIERFKDSGDLDSLDYNAYNLAWMFEWSNYDTLRIYSRDSTSNLDDDFEHIVFHQNTDMFYGRHIDHIWEYFHSDNEDRGRSKENDVNRNWKQALPGKHHYLFPQNTHMVRWAGRFMTKEQDVWVKKQVAKLMKDYDFADRSYSYYGDFEAWMRSVVVMDMIENGQLSFGQINFSDVATGAKPDERVSTDMIKKFEMFDLYADRARHLNYVNPKNFQAYLANPTSEEFKRINDKTTEFYSTRNTRQFPWLTLSIRAHWEVGSKHLRRLFNKPNLTSANTESIVEGMVGEGMMERKQGEKEKKKLFGFGEIGGQIKIGEFKLTDEEFRIKLPAFFGTTPFRRARQFMEGTRKAGWDSKFAPLAFLFVGFFAGLFELVKQLPKQTFGEGR